MNSTRPPVTISMRDWSSLSVNVDRLLNWVASALVPDAAIRASRCEFSAVSVESSSGRMALTLLPVSVTLPVASVAALRRWMVPRWLTQVVESKMPSCTMAWPASVMSPCCDSTTPVLVTVPLGLPA
ncbi:hypothetical protein [Rhodoplanes sp.]|uniref:hypothetical protein n=1 Tax=Rhodoplanes sp. TaxID=1968906 RepID=UPI0025F892BF|nr:hypothetical protein [Rhodoplanes sp.]